MLDGGQELDGLVHVVDAVVDEHVGETNEPASTVLHKMPNHRANDSEEEEAEDMDARHNERRRAK